MEPKEFLRKHLSYSQQVQQPGQYPRKRSFFHCPVPGERSLLFASSWVSVSPNHTRKSQNILQQPNFKLAPKTWPKEHIIQTLGPGLALCLGLEQRWKELQLRPLTNQEERMKQERRSFHYIHCELCRPVIQKSRWRLFFTKTECMSEKPKALECASWFGKIWISWTLKSNKILAFNK